jgi:IS5 family transposase
MLRLYNQQPDLWEAVLPLELRGLPAELAAMDEVLKDETFLAPFEASLHKKADQEVFSWFEGRPSTFMASYVRLMLLKFRHDWSYEALLARVNESVFLRRFCGYGLSDRLPDDTTLIKLTGRLGEDFIKLLNRAVVKEAKERKIVKGRRMRLDTTAVEANIHHPSDMTLLGDGIRVIGRMIRKIRDAGAAGRVKFRDRWRRAKKVIARYMRSGRGRTRRAVRKATRTLARMARNLAAKTREVESHVTSGQDESVDRWIQALARYRALLEKALEQARRKLRGESSLPDRLVSLFDPEARPIKRGKTWPPVEFGYKALFCEAEGGIVTHYDTFVGNPHDGTLLKDAVAEQKAVTGRYPDDLAGDRGFQVGPDDKTWLADRIDRVSIPRLGHVHDPPQRRRERTAWFRRLQRWRAGGEATGSLLKRLFGWRRSLMRGREGVATWVGYGVFAHNLWRLARITDSS